MLAFILRGLLKLARKPAKTDFQLSDVRNRNDDEANPTAGKWKPPRRAGCSGGGMAEENRNRSGCGNRNEE